MTKVAEMASIDDVASEYRDAFIPSKVNTMNVNTAKKIPKAGKKVKKAFETEWKRIMHLHPGKTIGQIEEMKKFVLARKVCYFCALQPCYKVRTNKDATSEAQRINAEQCIKNRIKLTYDGTKVSETTVPATEEEKIPVIEDAIIRLEPTEETKRMALLRYHSDDDEEPQSVFTTEINVLKMEDKHEISQFWVSSYEPQENCS